MNRPRLVLPALLAAASLFLPACYERTIRADGIGAKLSGEDVYEPNVKSRKEGGGFGSGVSDFLFGEPTAKSRER